MQIRDLIAELKRYPEHTEVCVEVTADNGHQFDHDDDAIIFDVATVARENDFANGVRIKLTLCSE